MGSSSGRKWFVGLAVIILATFGYIGWRGLTPDVQASVELSDMSIDRGDTITLSVENTGRKTITVGYPYEMWREETDGTLNLVELNTTWSAEVFEIFKGTSWSQEIDTDLKQGHYVLVKQYVDESSETHTHTLEFTVQ